MSNELTTNETWQDYWLHKNVIKKVKKNLSFFQIFHRELKNKKYKTMIEIGGFPGTYAVYFKKYWNFKPTILDYVFEKKLFNQVLKLNNLNKSDIEVKVKDFFKFSGRKKYDLVFSLGFIEHFTDIENVITRHWKLVNKKGKLIIGLPNFLGLNGVYQLLFDPTNLNIHNLDAMNISNLEKAIKNQKPKKYSIEYVSGNLVWLEDLQHKNILIRLLTYGLNFIGAVLTRLGVKNKFVSTHIFIVMDR
jgi:SAM-dependent methyltransferase